MARGSKKRIVVLFGLVLAISVELVAWLVSSFRDAARGVASGATTAWGTATLVTVPVLVLFVAWSIFGRRARG